MTATTSDIRDTDTTTDIYAKIRAQLLAKRADAMSMGAGLSADAQTWTETGSDLRREMLAEGDSSAVERGALATMSAANREQILDIDAALARLDAGTYGICTRCHKDIPIERLEFRPQAELCVPCGSRR